MATAKTVPTFGEWDARALALAEDAHLTGTARLLAENELCSLYGVRKFSPVDEHTVRVDRFSGGQVRRVSCDCRAGALGRACKHAGAVLHALHVRERAMSQPECDVFAHWRRGGEW